jgi:hypothetical protein
MQSPGNRIRLGAYSNTSGMPFTINESGGNVGINCNAPQYQLDVNGTTNFAGTVRIGASNAYYDDGAGRNIVGINVNGGNNCLQIANPSSFMQFFPGVSGYGALFRVGINNGATLVGQDLTIQSGGTEVIRFTSTSRVGIGTTSPAVQLDLSTDGARKLTTTTWTTGSDQRIKKNISSANIDLCYSTLKAIDLKYFEWDTSIPQLSTVQDHHSLGFIAQEVKTVFPKAVTFDSNMGLSDFHSLNVDQLYKAHYGTTKKLMEVVEQQGSTIKSIQQQLSTLQKS